MKPSSAKAKERKCRRCKEVFRPTDDSRICLMCKTECSKCGVKLTEENQDNSSRLLRQNYICKSCVATTVKESRGNKGFCQTTYDLNRKYGITLAEHKLLFEKGCFICGTKQKLCVDHDHATGKVRGCLCTKCNTGLGMFNDSEKRLKKAKRYLSRFKEK